MPPAWGAALILFSPALLLVLEGGSAENTGRRREESYPDNSGGHDDTHDAIEGSLNVGNRPFYSLPGNGYEDIFESWEPDGAREKRQAATQDLSLELAEAEPLVCGVGLHGRNNNFPHKFVPGVCWRQRDPG